MQEVYSKYFFIAGVLLFFRSWKGGEIKTERKKEYKLRKTIWDKLVSMSEGCRSYSVHFSGVRCGRSDDKETGCIKIDTQGISNTHWLALKPTLLHFLLTDS